MLSFVTEKQITLKHLRELALRQKGMRWKKNLQTLADYLRTRH